MKATREQFVEKNGERTAVLSQHHFSSASAHFSEDERFDPSGEAKKTKKSLTDNKKCARMVQHCWQGNTKRNSLYESGFLLNEGDTP